MIDLTRHPQRLRLLRALDFWDRLRAYARRRNRGWQTADRNLAQFYSRVWHEAAAATGATIESLGGSVFEMRRGERRTRVHQNCSAMDDLATHVIVRTKPVMYRLLNKHDLPTPRFLDFGINDLRKAVAFMETIGGDCVIKPASDTGGGLGVTTGIHDRWHLARAAYAADKHGGGIMIEEQVAGDNYRLLYLDGRLIDAVRRGAPSVVGDGKSTIGALVQAGNQARLQRGPEVSHALLTFDVEMQNTLAKQGLTLNSVPAAGQVVAVKTVINQNAGTDNITVTGELCDAIIEAGARAAEVAGVRLAGVDVITRDPARPLQETGGVILEVNSPPGYYWHYCKADGEFPVAVHVLNELLGDGKLDKHA